MHRQGQRVRTAFQEAAAPDPAYDIKADLAIAYGLDETLAERCASWRALGYRVHVMTGVAWSEDQKEYVEGRWDGIPHADERQTGADGQPRMHHPGVAYMVPTPLYGRFRAEKLRLAVDAGAEAIHLEEPEFWVSTGYGPAFRRLWEEHYGEPWQDPASSAVAQWRASALKAHAYLETLTVLCRELKAYARERTGGDIRFYVPTHSLVNYSQWGIVSPESRLLDIPGCDGYIAQVWTGTARTPNRYQGRVRERTFETAFLEYGAMADLVRGTDHRLWLLHDPVEDDPRHTWDDYRVNWQRTVVASLFQTHVADFELAPWPRRVFMGRYPQSAAPDSPRAGIPDGYASMLLGVMNALADMDQPAGNVRAPVPWGAMGLAVSDSMMHQRGRPGPGDLEYDQFYGQALPLIKAGVPLRPVQLDNLRRPGHLDGLRLLVLSYDLQKPAGPFVHAELAAWVRAGGCLLYVGDGQDPFAAIPGWWTQEPGQPSAAAHLWQALGVSEPAGAVARCGLGHVAALRRAPESCARTPEGCRALVAAARTLADAAGIPWTPGNSWVMDRGPYRILAVLDEADSAEPLREAGWHLDLFDPALPLRRDATLAPGEVGLWVRVVPPTDGAPRVLAAQGRIEPGDWDGSRLRFRAGGPSGTRCRARLWLPGAPAGVTIRTAGGDPVAIPAEWHPEAGIAGMCWENHPGWVAVEVRVG